MATELFYQLLPFGWRTVSFPVSKFTTNLSQEHAVHKWPDRDGAHVEATGRLPLTFSATIPFLNGVATGPRERWGVLYPDTFRSFLIACSDRTTGELQHPELGVIQAKFVSMTADWDALRRDGVIVTATWIESTDTPGDFDQVLASSSPATEVYIEAADLDTQLSQISPPPPWAINAMGNGQSFLQAIQQLTAVSDQVTLLSKRAGGYVDNILYQVNRLENSVVAAKNAYYWPVVNSCERLKNALYNLKQQQLVAQKDVSIWIVPKDQTLAALCGTLGASAADLIKLNPTLMNGAPVIKQGTAVRYYKNAAAGQGSTAGQVQTA